MLRLLVEWAKETYLVRKAVHIGIGATIVYRSTSPSSADTQCSQISVYVVGIDRISYWPLSMMLGILLDIRMTDSYISDKPDIWSNIQSDMRSMPAMYLVT